MLPGSGEESGYHPPASRNFSNLSPTSRGCDTCFGSMASICPTFHPFFAVDSRCGKSRQNDHRGWNPNDIPLPYFARCGPSLSSLVASAYSLKTKTACLRHSVTWSQWSRTRGWQQTSLLQSWRQTKKGERCAGLRPGRPEASPGQMSPNHWHSQHVMGTFWLHFSKALEFCIVVFFSLFSPFLSPKYSQHPGPVIAHHTYAYPNRHFSQRFCRSMMSWFWVPTRSQFSAFIGAIAKAGLRFWAVQGTWCVSFGFTTVQVPKNWRIFGLRIIQIYLLTPSQTCLNHGDITKCIPSPGDDPIISYPLRQGAGSSHFHHADGPCSREFQANLRLEVLTNDWIRSRLEWLGSTAANGAKYPLVN